MPELDTVVAAWKASTIEACPFWHVSWNGTAWQFTKHCRLNCPFRPARCPCAAAERALGLEGPPTVDPIADKMSDDDKGA